MAELPTGAEDWADDVAGYWRLRVPERLRDFEIAARIPPGHDPAEYLLDRWLGELRIYREIPPAAFEWTLRHLFLRTSFHPIMELRVTGGPGDKGADVVAKTYVDGVGPYKYVIQAKRYGAKRTVGFQDVSQFAGTCFKIHEADTAVMVTTSTFTPGARDLAQRWGILLCDFRQLLVWTEASIPPWDAEGMKAFLVDPTRNHRAPRHESELY